MQGALPKYIKKKNIQKKRGELGQDLLERRETKVR